MELYKYILAEVACFIVFLHVCFSIDCVENGLDPDNEDDQSLFEFVTKLEKYSGMNNNNFSIDINCEDVSACVVNSSGEAIWQARSKFYGEFMMGADANKDNQKETLDGCLCHSKNKPEFENCMISVRKKMITQIEDILVKEFVSIIENNTCALYTVNCIQ